MLDALFVLSCTFRVSAPGQLALIPFGELPSFLLLVLGGFAQLLGHLPEEIRFLVGVERLGFCAGGVGGGRTNVEVVDVRQLQLADIVRTLQLVLDTLERLEQRAQPQEGNVHDVRLDT